MGGVGGDPEKSVLAVLFICIQYKSGSLRTTKLKVTIDTKQRVCVHLVAKSNIGSNFRCSGPDLLFPRFLLARKCGPSSPECRTVAGCRTGRRSLWAAPCSP